MKNVFIGELEIGTSAPLVVVAGPCVIENEDLALIAAERLEELFRGRNAQLIYKSSYDKGNRSSIDSFRGPGLEEGLRILERIKREFELPIFTDVHSPEEAKAAAQVCDVIQIPAFLCRQTDLLVAAGKSGAVVNVKKGQFLAPWDMQEVVHKLESTGNEKILLTDRGTTFGYNNLVSDFRSIPIMQKLGYPVLFDATHSVQLPGGLGTSSGGQREFIPVLARAAIAAGCNGIYAETHPDIDQALCDQKTQLPLERLEALLDQWERLYEVVQCNPCVV